MIQWELTSERNLLRQLCKAQDDQDKNRAYDELQKRLKKRFEGFVLSEGWLDLKDQQEDIIQETIFRLVKYAPGLNGNSREFQSYLRRVMISVCSDLLEQIILEKYSLEQPLKETDAEDDWVMLDRLGVDASLGNVRIHPDWSAMYEASAPLPLETVFAQQESQALLDMALSRMNQRCQDLLRQADQLDDRQKHVAEIIGMQYGNVRTTLLRCRRELLQHLLQVLTEQQKESQEVLIEDGLRQLPEDEKTVLQAWWAGEARWTELGKLFVPALSQTEVKDIFRRGYRRLYDLLASQRDEEKKDE